VWSAQRACSCSDHQVFLSSCMRGRGRKLMAIQTEACSCQQEAVRSAARDCASAAPSVQTPKSACELAARCSMQRPDCGRHFVLSHSRKAGFGIESVSDPEFRLEECSTCSMVLLRVLLQKRALDLMSTENSGYKRECVLFIGTQFSNLYTSSD
jgi:hypothetical protein